MSTAQVTKPKVREKERGIKKEEGRESEWMRERGRKGERKGKRERDKNMLIFL